MLNVDVSRLVPESISRVSPCSMARRRHFGRRSIVVARSVRRFGWLAREWFMAAPLKRFSSVDLPQLRRLVRQQFGELLVVAEVSESLVARQLCLARIVIAFVERLP